MMKKLLGIVVLSLLLSSNAYAGKVKLICQGLLEEIEGYNFYINFDDKIENITIYRYSNIRANLFTPSRMILTEYSFSIFECKFLFILFPRHFADFSK